MASHLLILGERDAAARVVVSCPKMAVPSVRAAARLVAVRDGDELFLYATRGGCHNPLRDRGRAVVVTPPTPGQ